jgi:hypothetical protein
MTLSGTGTITPAPLSFSGSMTNPTKVYDGTTTASITPSDSSASLSGFVSGQNATYAGATGSFTSPNAGTGIGVTATLGTGNFTPSGTGFSWLNYALPTMTLSGTGTIGKATLTATANAISMTYGSSVPFLSGTVTGFVNGQTLSRDGGTASWNTSATLSSKPGQYGITGTVTLRSPWSGDYTIVQSPGNSSALTITQVGITSDNFNPVIQTVNLYQKLPALPGISSAGTSSGNPSSPFPSGKSMTLDASQNSSLMVIQPGGDDTSPDGILSVEELKN